MKKLVLLIVFVELFLFESFSQVTYSVGPRLNTARTGTFGSKLNDGRVLVVGGHGIGFITLNSAEIWSPSTNTFLQYTTNDFRDAAAVVKLANGKVLLAGGMSSDLGVGQLQTMEIFNPADNTFSPLCNLAYGARTSARGTELTSGKVLIAGCWWDGNVSLYGDVYDPISNTCAATGQLTTARANPLLLPMSDGSALVIGGGNPYGSSTYASIELYNPNNNQFSLYQNNFITGDSLSFWAPIYGNSDEAASMRMKDGKFLMLAGKTSTDTSFYTLVTIDPFGKTVDRLHTTPEIPIYNLNTGDSVISYQAVLDTAKNLCYLFCLKSTSTAYYEISIKAVNLSTNELITLDGHYLIPYYCFEVPKFVLNDGRIFIPGGSISNNFDSVDSTFFLTINVPTGVNDKIVSPSAYSLNQNYPNPFNPSTVIKFSVPQTSFVNISVYNMLGEKAATLVNETRSAGAYEINFNAGKLSSGNYIYVMTAGSARIVKKMALIK